LSKDSDAVWVATKGPNVVARPLKRQTLIQETQVYGDAWDAGEAEDVDTVVGTNHYNVVFVGKDGAVGNGLGCIAS
jgi:hypothetical protein